MPDYVTVISGIAHDYVDGHPYDINEAHLVSRKIPSEAILDAMKTLEDIAKTKHMPDLSFRLFELGKEVNLSDFA